MSDVKPETEVEKLKKEHKLPFYYGYFFAKNSNENLFFHIFRNELIQILGSVLTVF